MLELNNLLIVDRIITLQSSRAAAAISVYFEASRCCSRFKQLGSRKAPQRELCKWLVAMASRGTGSHFDSDKSSCTHPSYACFECTRVLVCGYPAEELQEIKATIEAGGGKVHTKLGKLQLPQVIVCGSAGDKTYKVGWQQTIGCHIYPCSAFNTVIHRY